MTAEQTAGTLAAGADCAAAAAAVRPALVALAHSAPAPAERGYAGPLAVPGAGGGSPCAVLALILPGDARYVAYRYEAIDGWGGGDCVADQPCAVGQAHWQGHPWIERGERTVVWSVFLNTSPERARRARLTAYFRPGPGWEQAAAP